MIRTNVLAKNIVAAIAAVVNLPVNAAAKKKTRRSKLFPSKDGGRTPP